MLLVTNSSTDMTNGTILTVLTIQIRLISIARFGIFILYKTSNFVKLDSDID